LRPLLAQAVSLLAAYPLEALLRGGAAAALARWASTVDGGAAPGRPLHRAVEAFLLLPHGAGAATPARGAPLGAEECAELATEAARLARGLVLASAECKATQGAGEASAVAALRGRLSQARSAAPARADARTDAPAGRRTRICARFLMCWSAGR